MPRKGVRVVITGKPRPIIDIGAMTNIIIALGRELAARERDAATLAVASTEVNTP